MLLRSLFKYRRYKTLVFFIDILMIYLAYLLGHWIVANFQFSAVNWARELALISLCLPIYLIFLFAFRLDRSLWRFASADEALKIVLAVFCSSAVIFPINFALKMPISTNVLIIANSFVLLFMVGVHFSYRLARVVLNQLIKHHGEKRTLIVGAGQAANLLIQEIRNNPNMNNNVICLVDDDPNKRNTYIQGIKVVGTTEDIPKVVKNYDIEEIIIAIPSASKKEIKRILQYCEKLAVKTKILPSFAEIVSGSYHVNKVHDVQIEDLLGRDPVVINTDGLLEFLQGEVVLVTGGGGSIGSELCRQIVKYWPKQLLILDIYENGAYDIQNELLRMKLTDTEIVTLIGSIRDEERMVEIFETYRPTIVFHAAAHKHVPLMEANPKEAIKNNIFGTYNVVKCSDRYKVKKFVLISTDKAVNPTNIMGATKRFAEMIIQAFNQQSETQFAAVRFGNVLGSNGSVIPLFKKQIAEGGPVTVTHKDIIRYFMTIPEAVQLVLQAGAFAKGGEIFVLDMGEPVKILDLAEQLIRLSGYKPYEEIDIQIIGLRPGEKLYEELLMDTEGLKKTENKKIFVLQQVDVRFDEIMHKLDMLEKLIHRPKVNIQEEFHTFVSTYRHPDEVNKANEALIKGVINH